jgi:hypothetical protein
MLLYTAILHIFLVSNRFMIPKMCMFCMFQPLEIKWGNKFKNLKIFPCLTYEHAKNSYFGINEWFAAKKRSLHSSVHIIYYIIYLIRIHSITYFIENNWNERYGLIDMSVSNDKSKYYLFSFYIISTLCVFHEQTFDGKFWLWFIEKCRKKGSIKYPIFDRVERVWLFPRLGSQKVSNVQTKLKNMCFMGWGNAKLQAFSDTSDTFYFWIIKSRFSLNFMRVSWTELKSSSQGLKNCVFYMKNIKIELSNKKGWIF